MMKFIIRGILLTVVLAVFLSRLFAITVPPAAMAADSGVMAGAEYLEVCTLVNRSVSSAAGQAMVMEQVAFMADRVLPWDSYGSLPEGVVDSPMSIGVE